VRLKAVPLPDDLPDPPPELPPGWQRAPQRIRPIRNSHDVCLALNSVYRDMRSGALPTVDGSRMANTLDVLRRAIESGDLEQRVKSLEAQLGARQGSEP
jgi:hypothetical protein